MDREFVSSGVQGGLDTFESRRSNHWTLGRFANLFVSP